MLYHNIYEQRPLEFFQYSKEQLRTSQRTPNWLLKAWENPVRFVQRDFLSKRFLRDSLFYCCAGNDSAPLESLSGLFHSAIYVDSYYDDGWLEREIRPWNLLGYTCFFRQKVPLLSGQEIEDTWREIALSLQNTPLRAVGENPRPNTFEEIAKELQRESPRGRSFSYVYLFRRHDNYGHLHGPKLLALTLLAGGAVVHYYHLYVRNRIAPRILCVNFPGMMDWSRIRDLNGIFYNLLKKHPASMPQLLMEGHESPYPEFATALYRGPSWRTPSIYLRNKSLFYRRGGRGRYSYS